MDAKERPTHIDDNGNYRCALCGSPAGVAWGWDAQGLLFVAYSCAKNDHFLAETRVYYCSKITKAIARFRAQHRWNRLQARFYDKILRRDAFP